MSPEISEGRSYNNDSNYNVSTSTQKETTKTYKTQNKEVYIIIQFNSIIIIIIINHEKSKLLLTGEKSKISIFAMVMPLCDEKIIFIYTAMILATIDGVWVGNRIYRNLTTHNYK
jgi:hypothetical protein